MIGKVLWDEFFSNRDWPLASAVAIILLLIRSFQSSCFNAMNKNNEV